GAVRRPASGPIAPPGAGSVRRGPAEPWTASRERGRRQRDPARKGGGVTTRVAEAVHDGARRMRARDRSVIRGKRMGGLSGAPIRFLSKATGYGQAVPLPGQYTWRQTKVDGSKPSGGQFGPSPGHFSA